MNKNNIISRLSILVIVVSASSNLVFAEEPLPGAENVCNRTELVKKERLVARPVEYKIVVDSLCGFLPCKKTVTEKKINTTREVHFVEVARRECCAGYAMTPELTCAPICLKPCKFGSCTAPNQCECAPAPTTSQPGYAGPQCNRFVCSAPDRWGPSCDKTCQCSETAFCEATTGKCLCRPGWRGANCTEECDRRSGCDDMPFLPPVYEPEVNVFKADDSSRVGRMSALSLERSNETLDSDDKKAFSRMLMAHLQINLLLVILASALIFALFCYKKKLSQLKNELYYAAYPGSGPRGSDSSGGYSSVYEPEGTIRNRPPMPLPNQPSYMDKNLSFATATRETVNGKSDWPHLGIPTIGGSKTERHLMTSKEASEQNIYSDIDQSSCAVEMRASSQLRVQTLVENEYQVPKSPARSVMDETNSHANLYEELGAPNPPAQAGAGDR